jgi:hypothetical protein
LTNGFCEELLANLLIRKISQGWGRVSAAIRVEAKKPRRGKVWVWKMFHDVSM